MIKLVLFDLDQTLVDSRAAEALRRKRQWRAVYRLIPELRPFDGIPEMWQTLTATKFTLGIVTSSPGSYCKRILRHLVLEPAVAVCYHDTRCHRPHPAPIEAALCEAEVPADKHVSLLMATLPRAF